MKQFILDPSTLPALDIVALTRTGALTRAERDTPENGVPAFMPMADWHLLLERFKKTSAGDTTAFFKAVEQVIERLLSHAAGELLKRERGYVSSTMSLRTDLFTDNGETYLNFIKDQSSSVACVIIGSTPWRNS